MPEWPGLPFTEASAFLRDKLSLPTQHWDDLRQGMHARAFVVAGAAKAELLSDLRGALQSALDGGTSHQDWRKSFDAIVQTHGWAHTGGRAWRARVIYQTNLSTAYHAGRFKQLQEVKSDRPWWQYRHGGSLQPRPDHLEMDGNVWAADDPVWQTLYPPNGWGCKCWVRPLSDSQMQARGLTPSPAPSAETIEAAVRPEWRYSVGEAAHGRRLQEGVMDRWRAEGASAWERLTPGDAVGRSALPVDPRPRLGPRAADRDELETAIARAIGGAEATFTTPDGARLVVNAAALAGHMPVDRAPFAPLLRRLIEDPAEIWLAFERHRGTGRVELRRRHLARADLRVGNFILAAQVARGTIEALTMVPTRDDAYTDRQRVGRLAWARGEGLLTGLWR